MNIDNLTIGEAKQILALLGNMETAKEESVDHGFCIAVLSQGFVYIGNVVTDSHFVKITDVRNIRRWGTDKGLGQLALEGPQENTILDKCGDIITPISELKHLMDCDLAEWL